MFWLLKLMKAKGIDIFVLFKITNLISWPLNPPPKNYFWFLKHNLYIAQAGDSNVTMRDSIPAWIFLPSLNLNWPKIGKQIMCLPNDYFSSSDSIWGKPPKFVICYLYGCCHPFFKSNISIVFGSIWKFFMGLPPRIW